MGKLESPPPSCAGGQWWSWTPAVCHRRGAGQPWCPADPSGESAAHAEHQGRPVYTQQQLNILHDNDTQGDRCHEADSLVTWHSKAQHCKTQHSIPWHGIAEHTLAQHDIPKHRVGSIAWHSKAWHSKLWHNVTLAKHTSWQPHNNWVPKMKGHTGRVVVSLPAVSCWRALVGVPCLDPSSVNAASSYNHASQCHVCCSNPVQHAKACNRLVRTAPQHQCTMLQDRSGHWGTHAASKGLTTDKLQMLSDGYQ